MVCLRTICRNVWWLLPAHRSKSLSRVCRERYITIRPLSLFRVRWHTREKWAASHSPTRRLWQVIIRIWLPTVWNCQDRFSSCLQMLRWVSLCRVFLVMSVFVPVCASLVFLVLITVLRLSDLFLPQHIIMQLILISVRVWYMVRPRNSPLPPRSLMLTTTSLISVSLPSGQSVISVPTQRLSWELL